MPEDIVIPERGKWNESHNVRKEVGKIVKNGPEDLAVLDKLKEYYNIEYSFDKDDALNIKTNQYIGSVYLPHVRRNLHIIPKIFKNKKDDKEYVKDTSILLFYANNNKIKQVMEGQKNFFTKEKEPRFVDPIHWSLLYEYNELMRRGLLKSYVVHADNISSMRGKLLMKQQMLNDAMHRPKFFCEYDELEYDNIENRVILQAMTIVERTSENQNVKMKSLNYAQRLSGVVQKENVRKPEMQRMMHSYNRQNDRYKKIHKTCETIIEKQGIENIYSGDYSHVVPIFYDMDKEFERFVGNLFNDYYVGPGYETHAAWEADGEGKVETQSSEEAWEGQGNLGPRRMRPDIVIREGNKVKHIIDVKYKTKGITTGDLYQIGFYMHEYGKYYHEEIKRAFALLPKYETVKEGSYIAKKTRKRVYVRCIDVKDCVEKIKTGSEAGLSQIVNSLIQE